MCGIAGYSGFPNLDLQPAIDAISHRGPDDQGIQYLGDTALGNTRLAIIDLSARGHQPIFDASKSLCITFNGEIYNFKSVKRKLEKKYKFKSHTDTEVILYAYKEWGVECLRHLDGMFAFVIYDLNRKLLFGARDRLGQKPLKYYQDKGKLIFASEIPAILSLLKTKPKIDYVALDDFLTWQYVPSPSTGFEKISKLPAAHYFLFQNGRLTTHRYWSLNFHDKLDLSSNQWSDLLYSQLSSSVKSHLVSDVPVGALLSGGLDSSLITVLAARQSKNRLNTFSIGFNDSRFDESQYAREVSTLCDTNHTELILSEADLVQNLEHIYNSYDEPIADNSILPTLMVSKMAGSHVKVALTGDGGDDNFAGYDRYSIVNISNLFKLFPHWPSKLLFRYFPNKFTYRADLFYNTLHTDFPNRYSHYNTFFTNSVKNHLYTKSYKKKLQANDSFKLFQNLYDPSLTDIDNALQMDINYYLPDDLLYKTDIASMAHGLELRSPFLDHRLMELSTSIPSSLKIRLLTKKYILKQMATRYKLLPDRIINRPKQGFNLPQNKWFKGLLRDYVTTTILDNKKMTLVFNKHKLESYVTSYFTTRLNYDNNIFSLISLSQWLNRYA